MQLIPARLTAILQRACSGERAAALAFRGYWKCLANGEELERIRAIEEDEWRHREEVGRMLGVLGAAPESFREMRALVVGRTLGMLCHVSGYLAPMFGAGLLESHNVREYEAAARLSFHGGRFEWVECLLTMAEVEWDHEQFFRGCVVRHWIGRRLALWKSPPPREHIRASFALECAADPNDGAEDAFQAEVNASPAGAIQTAR